MLYYIDGIKVSEEEATKQMELNDKIMDIEDNKEWLREAIKLRFVVVIPEEVV